MHFLVTKLIHHFSGHSLGAGLAVLLGTLLRPRYPYLRVYAFATPGRFKYGVYSENSMFRYKCGSVDSNTSVESSFARIERYFKNLQNEENRILRTLYRKLFFL